MSVMLSSNDGLQSADDKDMMAFLSKEGFINPKKLDDGEWVAIMQLAFTVSVCCGIERLTAYKYRWCFKDPQEAFYFLENIKDFDEVPTRRASLKGHRYMDNPLYIEKDSRGFNKW